MNLTRYRRNLIGGAVVLLVLLLGGAADTGLAHGRDHDRDRYGRYDDRVRWDKDHTKEYAFVLGYHNGYGEAREFHGRKVNYKDTYGYRNDATGWLAWMGHQDSYRSSYRKGFALGFTDHQKNKPRRFDRSDVERLLGGDPRRVYDDRRDRGRWGNDRGHRDGHDGHGRRGRFDRGEVTRIALENGYRDGFHHGREDRARRRNYDFDHSRDYRDATRGYRSEYGDRDFYRRAYREGYERGYNDGYNGRNARSGDHRRDRGWPWPF